MIALCCYIFFAIVLEMLPISSSTHMHFLASWLQTYEPLLANRDFVTALDESVHGIIVVIVAAFFFNRWWILAEGLPRTLPIIGKILLFGICVELITVFFYALFSYIGTQWFPVWLGFVCTTVLLYSLRFVPTKTLAIWNWQNAVAVGFAQGLSLLPGISRFGSTFTTARWCGVAPLKAFELSFLIEIPLLCAAATRSFYWLYAHNFLSTIKWPLLFCALPAAVVGYCILFLMQILIVYNVIWIVSIYTALLALIFLLV